MPNRLAIWILATTAVFAVSTAAFAQAAPKSQAKAPSAATQPDLSGVWMGQEGKVFGSFNPKEPPSLQAWAAEKFKATTRELDPIWKCLPPGVPRILLVPQPMEIVPIPGRVLMLSEYDHTVRQIYMDGREHPTDPDPTWLGHYIGKWDGDTLVVDTIGLNDKTWLDYPGHPHTEALHVIERYRRSTPDTLLLDITIDDPKTYTKPWTGQRVYKLRTDWEILEHFACDAEVRTAQSQNPAK